ncbi:UNVERIFIED_CONTAM: hypothetical protein Sradi_6408400 [Sesamum radiatum]|uniref:Uncharacterized protein n=1 Tax=Sesamum radiatum TaxID=300843 RepID=A0AAW2K5I8_SESRA
MQLHTKRKNRLEQKRLNDLVYIKYNRVLRRRYNARDIIDLIALDDIDKSNEWLFGRLNHSDGDDDKENARLYEDDDLTWGDVSGVDEDAYAFRHRKRLHLSDEEEEVNFFDMDEEDLDCYKSNSDRQNKTNDDDDEEEEIGENLDFD